MTRLRSWHLCVPVLMSLLAPDLAFADETHVDRLDNGLLKQARRVVEHLRTQGLRNVGILKFLVQKGNDAPSDNVGPLNLTIAERLEIALVLCNDNRADRQLGIIRNASKVAAGIAGANHLTRDGRGKLFAGRYPLAWGDQAVAADGFVTGIIRFKPDLRSMTIGLSFFGQQDQDLRELGQEFTVATDPTTLIEAGESYSLRGAFDGGKVIAEQCAEQADKVKKRQNDFPLQPGATPVVLRVFYDDKEISFELKDGRALLREPTTGQKVVFVVERKGDLQERLAVVLMVNGENSLYRERRGPMQCSKWILGAGVAKLPIEGYQTGKDKAEAFHVLSREESKPNEINYGADVGTIALTVFRERREKEKPPSLSEDAEDAAAIAKGQFPSEAPPNLAALQGRLRAQAQVSRSRGLIVPGKEIDVKTREVEFAADPVPILSATLTYYRP